MSHSLLLDKLKFYGFEDGALSLMKSYLSGRCQKVMYDERESSFLLVSHGVLKVKILGLILFIIYINDFSFNLSTPFVNSYLFANDLSICFNGKSNESWDLNVHVLASSKIVQSWCNANRPCI